MQKCIEFGFDGTITIVGQTSSIINKFKIISLFVISTHCIAHRTNLVALEATKSIEYKCLYTKIDIVVNSLPNYFLSIMEKYMLLIWLKFEWCRKKLWKNIIKLKCCLYFRPYSHCVIFWSLWLCIFVTCQGKTLIALTLYDKLRNFKYIYILYFLVDLLHDLTILSKIFQYKFVDAANIRSFVKKQI